MINYISTMVTLKGYTTASEKLTITNELKTLLNEATKQKVKEIAGIIDVIEEDEPVVTEAPSRVLKGQRTIIITVDGDEEALTIPIAQEGTHTIATDLVYGDPGYLSAYIVQNQSNLVVVYRSVKAIAKKILCPICYSQIFSSIPSQIATWSDDPTKTPNGLAGEDYIGFQRTLAKHIKEIQDKRTEQELLVLDAGDRTQFSSINDTGFFVITKNHVLELRESTEKLLEALGDSKYNYFNYDEDGNYMGSEQTDWHDKNFNLATYHIKAIHIEDLRHFLSTWLETWENTSDGNVFTTIDTAEFKADETENEHVDGFTGNRIWFFQQRTFNSPKTVQGGESTLYSDIDYIKEQNNRKLLVDISCDAITIPGVSRIMFRYGTGVDFPEATDMNISLRDTTRLSFSISDLAVSTVDLSHELSFFFPEQYLRAMVRIVNKNNPSEYYWLVFNFENQSHDNLEATNLDITTWQNPDFDPEGTGQPVGWHYYPFNLWRAPTPPYPNDNLYIMISKSFSDFNNFNENIFFYFSNSSVYESDKSYYIDSLQFYHILDRVTRSGENLLGEDKITYKIDNIRIT